MCLSPFFPPQCLYYFDYLYTLYFARETKSDVEGDRPFLMTHSTHCFQSGAYKLLSRESAKKSTHKEVYLLWVSQRDIATCRWHHFASSSCQLLHYSVYLLYSCTLVSDCVCRRCQEGGEKVHKSRHRTTSTGVAPVDEYRQLSSRRTSSDGSIATSSTMTPGAFCHSAHCMICLEESPLNIGDV